MPSHRQIAKDWGVSSGYVDRCVKRGCPTDTFENARLWRIANTTRASKQKKPTMEEAIDELQIAKQVASIPELEENVRSAKQAVIESRRFLNQAFLEEKPSKISTFLNIHGKALEMWVKAENLLRNAKVEEGILVSLNEAMARFRQPIEQLVQRITAFPQNVAARVNPHNPGHAMDILQQECIAMIRDAQRSIGYNGSTGTIQ